MTASLSRYSVMGFHQVEDSGFREVFNFGAGWRFLKKDASEAWQAGFDDSQWETVNIPHALELLPENANSSFWYRGPAWYRKHFTLPAELKGRILSLYFEGVMQKCTVWINGQECATHFGGFLPFLVDLTPYVKFDGENVIAVMADNSDDHSFPVGRDERMLGFCYFGGIYRQVWLAATDTLHVSDPIRMNKVADGGLFVHSENVSEDCADLIVKTNLVNEGGLPRQFVLETSLLDPSNKFLSALTEDACVLPGSNLTVEQKFHVENPRLWSSETPHLYRVVTRLRDSEKTIDAVETRTGIRSVEMRGTEFYLNGKKRFLFGANRHQDHAFVGMAVPKSEQWRDAVRLREASFECIRSHYPQDAAFMDACDELGLFAITSVPGWWFYTPDEGFPERTIQAVREMIRINRNRPSCFLWEIGLNEAFYPSEFIIKEHAAAHEEYPYPGCFTAEDGPTAFHGGYYKDGQYVPFKDYDRNLVNAFPTDIAYRRIPQTEDKPLFQRECGDRVDSFQGGQNGPSRVCRDWGETPMALQSQYYANCLTSWSKLRQDRIGLCLWLAFDHYTGYTNENSYQGIMDCYRLPKTSFYLYKSQNPPRLGIPGVPTGPMIHIANYLTPFSPQDIVVYTNCEKVRLTFSDGQTIEGEPEKLEPGFSHPPVIFKDAFKWQKDAQMWTSPTEKHPDSGKLVAEGLIDGKVAARAIRQAASRVVGLKLEIDDLGIQPVADGGDFVQVRADLIDAFGNARVLGRNQVYFSVEGEGRIVGNEKNQANPFHAQFGTAVAIIRTTSTPGKIKVTAMTTNMGCGSVTFESRPSPHPLIKGIPSAKPCRTDSLGALPGGSVNHSGMSSEEFEAQWLVTPVEHPEPE